MTTADLLQARRLSQRCPTCGIVEAAGAYCTACLTRTTEADWFTRPIGRGARRRKAETPGSVPSGTDDRVAA